jgi:hypothetical protein
VIFATYTEDGLIDLRFLILSPYSGPVGWPMGTSSIDDWLSPAALYLHPLSSHFPHVHQEIEEDQCIPYAYVLGGSIVFVGYTSFFVL